MKISSSRKPLRPTRGAKVCTLSDAPLGDAIAVTRRFNVVVGINSLGKMVTVPGTFEHSLGTLHACSLFP